MALNLLWQQLELKNWDGALAALESDDGEMVKSLHRSKLPLHYSIKNKAPDSIVLALIEACEDAVTKKGGSYDMLPLHYAVAYASSYNIIKRLVSLYPESLEERDKSWYTPGDYTSNNFALYAEKLDKKSKRTVCMSANNYEAKIAERTTRVNGIVAKVKIDLIKATNKIDTSMRKFINDLSSSKTIGDKEKNLNVSKKNLQSVIPDLDQIRDELNEAIKELSFDLFEEVQNDPNFSERSPKKSTLIEIKDTVAGMIKDPLAKNVPSPREPSKSSNPGDV